MEISILLARQIVELFIMILMGYALVRFKALKAEDSKGLSVIALYLITPCIIINSFQTELTGELAEQLLLALAASVVLHILFLLVGRVLSRILRLDVIEELSIIYTNAGNLLIPIVTAVLGEKYVIYTSAFISVQLVQMWTHCKSRVAGERLFDWKALLTNVNIIAIIVGVLMLVLRIKLPTIVAEAFSSVGATVGPVFMFIIGMSIGGVKLREVFGSGRVYLVSASRLLLAPLLLLPLFRLAAQYIQIPDARNVLLVVYLASIAPSAAMLPQFAIVYGKEAGHASAINIMTTLFSMLTMPLMVLLYLL